MDHISYCLHAFHTGGPGFAANPIEVGLIWIQLSQQVYMINNGIIVHIVILPLNALGTGAKEYYNLAK